MSPILLALAACSIQPSRPAEQATDADEEEDDEEEGPNLAPVIASVVIGPDLPRTDDTIVATVDAVDPEGGPVTLAYVWSVDGLAIDGFNSASLPGAAYFDAGAVVFVTVTPSDGVNTGAALTSNALTVANTAPAVEAPVFDPISPDTCDQFLVCSLAEEATDADGDAVATSVSWTRDGATVEDAGTTTLPGDTLDIGDDAVGTVYGCTLEADDGEDRASASSETTRVEAELVAVGWFDTQPGGCGDGNEATGTDGTTVDAARVTIEAVSCRVQTTVGDGCGSGVGEDAPEGLDFAGSWQFGTCDPNTHGESSSGITAALGGMTLYSDGAAILVPTTSSAGEYTAACPTGYASAGVFHVGPWSQCCTYPYWATYGRVDMLEGYAGLCVLDGAARLVVEERCDP